MKYFFIILLLLSSWMGYGNPSAPQAADECKKHNFCQLVCQAPPKDGLTGKLIDPSNPIFRDSFSPREAVWVAVNRDLFGVENCARVYVVNHRTDWKEKNKILLEDVSGGYETITPPENEKVIYRYRNVWETPDVREEGYDVVVDFTPLGEYNNGKDIVDGIDQAAFIVPKHWIYLESISFNYDRNCNCWDAINIRGNWCQDVRVPEWMKGQSFPTALIKKRKIKIKATFLAASSIKKAKIRAAKKNGLLRAVDSETVEFKKSENTDNIIRGEAIFRVIGRTPGEIRKDYQHWRWQCKKIFLNDGNDLAYRKMYFGDSLNKIFIVLEKPQSPWCHDREHAPWVDVLDLSCQWADGAMTPEEAASKISQHMYCGLGGSYCRGGSYTSEHIRCFDLIGFMSNIALSGSIGEVNCADMGKALVIFSNAIGCGLSYWKTITKFRNRITFNNIERIGGIIHDPDCDSDSDLYDYHGFAGIHGRVIKVFDATFRKLPGWNPDDWLTNISWCDYKTKVLTRNCEVDIQPFPFAICKAGK